MDVIGLLATASLGQEELVDRVARIVCGGVADCCAIAVLSDNGRALHPLGLFDCRQEVMEELDAQPELAWEPAGGLSEQALSTGQPILITGLDPKRLARGRPLAQTLLVRLALDSAIIAPMHSAGAHLGIVAVGRTGERPAFSDDDVPYIQTLAWEVALGLANARLRERSARSTAPGSAAPDDLVESLTEREREILHLIGEGLTNREIGERLYLSVRTIEWHRSNLSSKLGLTRRSELIAVGRRLAP